MKRISKGLMVLALFAAAFISVPGKVSAATVLPEAVDGVITLTEDVTLTETFVVEKDKEITLNLNGHTLDTTSGDTVYVELGATLTITGNGTITNNIHGKAPLFNNGKTTIDGATLSRNDTSNTNTYYVILNHGTMEIKDVTVKNPGVYSSLVANGYYDFTSTNERKGHVVDVNQESPSLTIDGGVFDGGMNTIKNDDNASLIINDGTFKNSYQVSLMNWSEAYINGGTFETPTGNDKTNIYVNSSDKDYNKGILVINDGTFNAEHLLEGPGQLSTAVEINGGTFNYTDTFFNEEKTSDSVAANGAEIVGSVTAPVSALEYAKEGSDVTINSELAIGDVLDVPAGVVVYLPEDKIGELVFVENEDGTFTVAKSANISALIEIAEYIDSLNEEDYTEESLNAFEEAVTPILEELENLNYTEDEQDLIDDLTEQLKEAVKLLVEKNSAPSEENPNTGDNIILYVILGLISACGCGYILKKRRFN